MVGPGGRCWGRLGAGLSQDYGRNVRTQPQPQLLPQTQASLVSVCLYHFPILTETFLRKHL